MYHHSIKTWVSLFCCLFIAQPAFTQEAGAAPDAGTYFTSFDDTRIYYEVRGEGQPVVLLHGFTNTIESWKSKILYQALLDNGFKVIALDLRGNGKSDKPETVAGYVQDAETRDVSGLVSLLGLSSYQLVGYSRGSIIASRLLVLDKRVSAAVLGGMGDALTNPDWPRRMAFYKALIGEGDTTDFQGFLRYVDESGLDRQTLAFQQQAQSSTSPTDLASVKIPVLVISGDADHENGSAEALAKLIPAARVKRTPGVHNTAHQSPQFSQEVLSFLQQNRHKH
ncbi:alpha/beta fold hydrolase [Cesiribacter sp. SM1]|uniref:alpha/beta fold hydrolase n=1 Tax=Cesiribacter sp. SM1 TaxID=2861196 RepID=UPI001CD3B750|nr:alpha/beta hydrolase [Cesiribacter sp. SM1]